MAAILVMVVLVPVGVWIAVRLENGLDASDNAATTGTDLGADPVRNQPCGLRDNRSGAGQANGVRYAHCLFRRTPPARTCRLPAHGKSDVAR
jgi:hypothetical protein